MKRLAGLAAAGLVLVLGASGCSSAPEPADAHAGHEMSGMTPLTSVTATRGAGNDVTVSNFQFSPATLRTTLGADVTWSFPDVTAHTTTSTQGFWDSGSKAEGATFTFGFRSAGTYPYRCTIHSSMTGKVEVPMKAKGDPASGWRISWATTAASDGTYDVQVKRPGTTTWVALKTGTTLRNARFGPARAGTYSLRARTHVGASRSDWSRAKVLRIS